MIDDRLDRLARDLAALPAQLVQATAQVVEDNAFLLELENQQQLEAGLDSNDRPITPAYAPLTVLLKQEAGQEYRHVTLRDTGAFYAGIVAQVHGQVLEVEGTEEKTSELQDKYGKAIIGLSLESLDSFREEVVRPELEAEARKILGL